MNDSANDQSPTGERRLVPMAVLPARISTRASSGPLLCLAASLALSMSALVLSGCAPEPEAPLDLVVWFEVDTLRADALGCYGHGQTDDAGRGVSAEIDRMANEGWLFERAYSAAPWTAPSLVSQLTGLAPWEHGVSRLLQPVPDNLVCLPELIAAEGWSSGVVTANFVTQGSLGFWQGFDRIDDRHARGHEGRTGMAVVETGVAMLDELWEARDHGVLLWLHLFEPHYRYEAGNDRRFGPGFGSESNVRYDGELDGTRSLDELRAGFSAGRWGAPDAAFLRGLYQSEVAAVDVAFGQLRSELEARGLWERALILFTSDHGEELGERGWVGHTIHLRDSLVRVPLLIKPPSSWSGAPARFEAPVSQLDLFATLVDWTGALAPSESDVANRSMAPWLAGRASKPQREWIDFGTDFVPLREGADVKRARSVGRLDPRTLEKWVWSEIPEESFERFDLERDPSELSPTAGKGSLAPERPTDLWGPLEGAKQR